MPRSAKIKQKNSGDMLRQNFSTLETSERFPTVSKKTKKNPTTSRILIPDIEDPCGGQQGPFLPIAESNATPETVFTGYVSLQHSGPESGKDFHCWFRLRLQLPDIKPRSPTNLTSTTFNSTSLHKGHSSLFCQCVCCRTQQTKYLR